MSNSLFEAHEVMEEYLPFQCRKRLSLLKKGESLYLVVVQSLILYLINQSKVLGVLKAYFGLSGAIQ